MEKCLISLYPPTVTIFVAVKTFEALTRSCGCIGVGVEDIWKHEGVGTDRTWPCVSIYVPSGSKN